jgi:hypothetical protein
MPTIMCDAIEHAGPPLISPRPYGDLLAQPFDPEAEFYVKDGVPYVAFPDWDYAENWGGDRMREVHPFIPIIYGKRISEAAFCARVRLLHGLGQRA